MSIIKNKFYYLFWNNPACRNLFLLSKEELLETRQIGELSAVFTTNRIIVSNAEENEENHIETVKVRSNLYDIDLENSLQKQINFLKPIFEQFLDEKFKKSINKLGYDIENNTLKFITRVLKIILNEEKREELTIKLLQNYGFIGTHLNSFQEVEESMKRGLTPSKKNNLINEQTIYTFFEGIKYVKEMYINHSYKSLYNSNQILVNVLNNEDNFNSRIKLFGELYDSKILLPSTDDAFIECSYCDSNTYKGVFQLKLNPKKLKELKCPVCSKELTYFVPYKLEDELYNIIKSPDGLILDALCNKLNTNRISYQLNCLFFEDIEIDCIFRNNNKIFIVETKMYKQNNTTPEKILSKIKAHFDKLVNDTKRLENIEGFNSYELIPTLMININNESILKEAQLFFKSKEENNKYYISGRITSLNYLDLS